MRLHTKRRGECESSSLRIASDQNLCNQREGGTRGGKAKRTRGVSGTGDKSSTARAGMGEDEHEEPL